MIATGIKSLGSILGRSLAPLPAKLQCMIYSYKTPVKRQKKCLVTDSLSRHAKEERDLRTGTHDIITVATARK